MDIVIQLLKNRALDYLKTGDILRTNPVTHGIGVTYHRMAIDCLFAADLIRIYAGLLK